MTLASKALRQQVAVATERRVSRQGPPVPVHELPGDPFDVMARQLGALVPIEDLPGVDIDVVHRRAVS